MRNIAMSVLIFWMSITLCAFAPKAEQPTVLNTPTPEASIVPSVNAPTPNSTTITPSPTQTVLPSPTPEVVLSEEELLALDVLEFFLGFYSAINKQDGYSGLCLADIRFCSWTTLTYDLDSIDIGLIESISDLDLDLFCLKNLGYNSKDILQITLSIDFVSGRTTPVIFIARRDDSWVILAYYDNRSRIA